MGTPAASVILPTWNRAAYLRTAVDSVLGQTMGDLELIVVDDGSTDGSADVLARVHDERLRVLRREHGGISAAMNAGLAAARAPIVGRVDSDDVWLPTLLAEEIAVLAARPEVGVVYARAQAMTSDGTPLPLMGATTRGRPPPRPDDAFASLLEGDFTCNITVLARRTCLDRAGPYDESLIANEDWDLWLRVARHCSFAFVDRVLARFRIHADSLTDPRSPRFVEVVESRLRVLDKVFAQPDLPPAILADRDVSYRNALIAAGQRLLAAGHPTRAAAHFRGAFARGGSIPGTAAHIAAAVLGPRALAKYVFPPRAVEAAVRAYRRVRPAAS